MDPTTVLLGIIALAFLAVLWANLPKTVDAGLVLATLGIVSVAAGLGIWCYISLPSWVGAAAFGISPVAFIIMVLLKSGDADTKERSLHRVTKERDEAKARRPMSARPKGPVTQHRAR